MLSDSHFVSLALIASCSLATFFVYVANSSFVFTGHYGLTPRVYALLFAINAVTLVLISQVNGWVTARLGLRRTVRIEIVCHAVTIALLDGRAGPGTACTSVSPAAERRRSLRATVDQHLK